MKQKLFLLSILAIIGAYIYSSVPVEHCTDIIGSKEMSICLKEAAYETLEPKYCENIIDMDKREICSITLIGRALDQKKLTTDICLEIKHEQTKNDCISYYSDTNKDLAACMLIKGKKHKKLCLGEIKRIFTLEETIKSTDMCITLKENDFPLWHDQCIYSYVQKNNIKTADTCKNITNPLAFYNCVKTIAVHNDDPNICTNINKIVPFPANYPTNVFSVDGCRHWVTHDGSYAGMK